MLKAEEYEELYDKFIISDNNQLRNEIKKNIADLMNKDDYKNGKINLKKCTSEPFYIIKNYREDNDKKQILFENVKEISKNILNKYGYGLVIQKRIEYKIRIIQSSISDIIYFIKDYDKKKDNNTEILFQKYIDKVCKTEIYRKYSFIEDKDIIYQEARLPSILFKFKISKN